MSAWLFGAAKLLLAVQATDAAIVGTVRDSDSREPVANAVVTLADIGRSVVTDGHGRYAIRSIGPGPQHVTVRRIGYAPRSLHALVPRRGDLEIDVALRRTPVRLRSVEVRPSVAVRGAEEGSHRDHSDRNVSLAAVRNHPLLAEPDALLALGGGDVVMRAEAPSGVHVRGGASDQTGYLLDGVPILSPYHAAGTFSAWNPDALARVDLWTAPRAGAVPDALSGTVVATTRPPGSRTAAQGSLSTTQARLTMDGALGIGGAGYLVSVRSGFPGFIAPEREPSYLTGESGDLLAKVEAPAWGGRARLIYYENANETGAAAQTPGASAPLSPSGPRRHDFEWYSRSAGIEWARRFGRSSATVQAWSATAAADARWNDGGDSALAMTSERRDLGLVATLEHRAAETTTLAAVRVRQSRTVYRAVFDDVAHPSLGLDARTPLASLFIGHDRPFLSRLTANVALSATAAAGHVYFAPQALLRWRPSSALTLSGSYARSHQFTQSLRNAESIIGTVFPADLFVGANAPGVPVARADNVAVGAELRPLEGVRLAVQTYARAARGLVLVAPSTAEPFATGGFATGTSDVRGVTLDAALSAARYGLLASYGWQRVRLRHDGASYTPDYGAAHLVDGGAIVFPSATSSIRVGAAAALGRRASGLVGTLETEGCNLLDRGCELAGTPRIATGRLGATKLPAYLRVDVGARKHWDLELAGREAVVGLSGTITNVFAHGNVLTVITDPETGRATELGMRPLAPLVIGVDWRF
ncbi:MAG TPA: TonB-dependent receptor [Gemmatimonadaceae bacterium]|jgi:hypothetical protein|nr:TonB-dependent receptor [Gemmatimonadaceae bacterium]